MCNVWRINMYLNISFINEELVYLNMYFDSYRYGIYTFFKFNLISLLQRMIKIYSLVVYCNAWVAATQCYLWSQLTVIVGVYRWWSSTQTSTPQWQCHTPQTPTPRDGRWGWGSLPNPPGEPANHGKLPGLSVTVVKSTFLLICNWTTCN